MKSEMTALARGLKWGAFEASGDFASAASTLSRSRSHASASPPMPSPARNRRSRREKNLVDVKEFIEVQDHVGEVCHGLARGVDARAPGVIRALPGEKPERGFKLLRLRVAPETDAVRRPDLSPCVRTRLLEHACREVPRLHEDKLVVHQGECLRR